MLYDPKWQVVVDPDFEAAATYIEKHGWCQGRNTDSDGRVCMIGAVFQTNSVSNGLLAIKRLCREMRRMDCTPEQYNDAPGRTKEEVVATLRRLARL